MAAFLKAFMLTVPLHLFTVIHFKHLFIYSTDVTVKTAAGHESAIGRDSEMAIAAVAAVINGICVKTLRNLEQTFLIKKECPEVILKVECGLGILILLKFCPTRSKEVTIPIRLYVPCFHVSLILTGGTVAAKGKDICLMLNDYINKFRNIINVGGRDGGHYGAVHATTANGGYGLNGTVIRTGLAETVMRLAQSIERQLIFSATQSLHPGTDLISKVERVAHDGEGYAARVDEFQEIPEPAVQYGVAAGYIEVRQAVHTPGHTLNVVKH